MIGWVVAGEDVIGPFPHVLHAREWAGRWGLDAEIVESAKPPRGYRYTVKESEAFFRSVSAAGSDS